MQETRKKEANWIQLFQLNEQFSLSLSLSTLEPSLFLCGVCERDLDQVVWGVSVGWTEVNIWRDRGKKAKEKGGWRTVL
jgi:hypothetical protein